MRFPWLRPVATLGLPGCWAAAWASASVFALGCGLRSDPTFSADTERTQTVETETDSSGGSTEGNDETSALPPEEGRLGSCSNPIDLPTTDSAASGTLLGGGLYTGLCEEDGGLEDVYRFTTTQAVDVTITFDQGGTDFPPTVRVYEFGCSADDGILRVCTNDWFQGDAGLGRHFIALGGRDYFIHVDSPSGNGGDYAFDVSLAPPPLAQCDPHPETIFQAPGSVFRWENDFLGGQGRVDSQCGGLGRENMFPVEMFTPGPITVSAFGFNGFRPVVSVRRACSAGTEVGCASELTLMTPGSAVLEAFIDTPGTYFATVDSLDLDPGTYSLEVSF